MPVLPFNEGLHSLINIVSFTEHCLSFFPLARISNMYDVRLDGKKTASENKYLMLILQTCFGRSRPQCHYFHVYV